MEHGGWACTSCATRNTATVLACVRCGLLWRVSVMLQNERRVDPLCWLPLHCVLDVLSRLSPRERLLAMAVSRSWRAAVCSPLLWKDVDLTSAAETRRVNDALLAAVVEKAAGTLEQLSVTVRFEGDEDNAEAMLPREAAPDGRSVSVAAVRDAVQHAGAFLSHLAVFCPPLKLSPPYCPPPGVVHSLLDAASESLISLYSDAEGSPSEVQAMLRTTRDPPFGKLCLRRLLIRGNLEEEDAATFIPLLTGLAGHSSLKELVLRGKFLLTFAVVGSLVDVVIANGITALRLEWCALEPPSMVHIARLVTLGQLNYLYICLGNVVDLPLLNMADERASCEAFCAALRSNTSITTLALIDVVLWVDTAAGEAIITALFGHPSIRNLSFHSNVVVEADEQIAVGTILARLLIADSQCLHLLDLAWCALGDDGMRPIVDALRSNTHLLDFFCSHNGLTPLFARDVLSPALAVNASLRSLMIDNNPSVPELVQAEAQVASLL